MDIKEISVSSSGLNLWTQHLSGQNSTKGTVFLISGAGATAFFWSDDFCHILVESGYSVIRFDHRDCGLSDGVNWQKKPYTIDDLVLDLICIADEYGVNKMHLVGHSMGGIVAQLLASEYPQRILSYVSMSVAIGYSSKLDKATMEALLQNKPTQNFQKDLPGFMRVWEILHGDYAIDQEKAEYYTRDLYMRAKYPVDVAWHHIWCQDGVDPTRVSSITVPGLFIHGDKDALIPFADAVKAQQIVPQSHMTIVPGMGHMFFNQTLEDMIAADCMHHFDHLDC